MDETQVTPLEGLLDAMIYEAVRRRTRAVLVSQELARAHQSSPTGPPPQVTPPLTIPDVLSWCAPTFREDEVKAALNRLMAAGKVEVAVEWGSGGRPTLYLHHCSPEGRSG